MAAQARKSAEYDLGALSPDELEEFKELAKARRGGEGLWDFICRLTPHEPPPRHLRPLIDAIEEARRRPVKICVSMPPRHAKTETLLKGIAWWLSKTPADTCAYLTHGQDLANSKSRKTRNYAKAVGVRLSEDSNALHEWRTTQGGGLLAGGAGGPLTGQGVTGFMVVDDPFKNREEADSEGHREKIWEWFNEVAMTRLERASVIVVHTRWHEDDLIGRLSKMPDWKVIRLPAIAEAADNDNADPIGRRPGEALWPERYPVLWTPTAAGVLGAEAGQHGSIRGQIGEFSFAALYQQQPRPRGSKLFGAASYFDRALLDMTAWRLVIGGDPAATAKTSGNWSVGIVLAYRGRKPELEFRILEMYREQVSVPEYARALRALQLQWGMAPIYVEAVAGFKAVPQLLREQDPSLLVFEAPAVGDKFTRAQLAAAAWNARPSRLLVPLDAPPWLAPLLHELRNFSGVNDAEDDIVDALAHAVNAAIMEPDAPELGDDPGVVFARRV